MEGQGGSVTAARPVSHGEKPGWAAFAERVVTDSFSVSDFPDPSPCFSEMAWPWGSERGLPSCAAVLCDSEHVTDLPVSVSSSLKPVGDSRAHLVGFQGGFFCLFSNFIKSIGCGIGY